MRIKVLLVGCGDIALRLAARLDIARYHCFGLRRNPAALPATITGLGWDLNQADGLGERLRRDVGNIDVAIITLVPNERSEAGYHQAYVKNLGSVLTALRQQAHRPALTLFASSTSVYGQNRGEWVNEDSRTEPERFNGEQLLLAEQALAASSLASCALRFSGIYGPGRERILRQVRAGELQQSKNGWTNRIHADDCAGVMAHLIGSVIEQRGTVQIPNTLIATDCVPCPHTDLTYWLAAQLGMPVPNLSQAVEGGKRCSNRRLLDLGYRFAYPSFKEGYGDLLASEPER